LARLASLPFAPVEGSAKTLAYFSLHPGVDVACHSRSRDTTTKIKKHH